MIENEITVAQAPAVKITQNQSIRECIQRALSNYFAQLGDQQPNDLYDMVMAEVKAPLLESVMSHTKHNQSKAAIMLGISRGTLRKMLKLYNIE